MNKSEYSASFKRPEWQKKRLEILKRDDWTCQACGEKEETLHAHHKWYEFGKLPWEYQDECLVTLCETCHSSEHEIKYECVSTLVNTILGKGCFYGDFIDIASVINDMDNDLFAKRFNVERMKIK